MSGGQRLFAWGQGEAGQRLQRLGRMFVVILVGTLVAGYLAMLTFSASACFISHVIRCFSISRDLVGLSWFALKSLSLPAVVAAVLITMILQIRGSVVWWNVLVASLLSALVTGFVGRIPIVLDEMLLLLVVGLILFIGAQASLLISNRLGRSSI